MAAHSCQAKSQIKYETELALQENNTLSASCCEAVVDLCVKPQVSSSGKSQSLIQSRHHVSSQNRTGGTKKFAWILNLAL